MALVNKTFSDIITFTRASTGTFFNSAGVLTSAAVNEARFDYNPSTLAAQGLLIEEARTNSIRNNTMQGAVAGTPGTLPTNWITQAVGGVALTQVVGVGTENGIAYIDVRYAGTTSSTASGGILTESSTQIAAANGQTWAGSFFIRLISGSVSGITSVNNSIFERDAGGVLLAQTTTVITPTSNALNTQRVATTRTLNNASTAFVQQRITIFPQSGAAIDITLRIGLPQLENNNISTGVSSATVQAGGTGYTNGDTLTVVGGTGTAATLTVTGVSSGVITSVSVATAGSYSVFPTSPASVTGGTGTLATFNLTPVAQTGFATSVIQTSGTTATRSADQAQINTLSPWFNATEGTLVAETPAVSGPSNSTITPTRAATLSDGTTSNRIIFYTRQLTTISGGVTVGDTTPTGTGLDAGKRGWAYKLNDAAYVKDGGTVQTDFSFTVPVTMSQLVLGSNSPFTATTNLNGCISRLTYYPRRLSNAELQTITT